jgi:hypothetical protein
MAEIGGSPEANPAGIYPNPTEKGNAEIAGGLHIRGIAHRAMMHRDRGDGRRSGCPHRFQELADLELEAVAVAGQRLRRGQNLR